MIARFFVLLAVFAYPLSSLFAGETSMQILFVPTDPLAFALGGDNAVLDGGIAVNPALLLNRTRPEVTAGMTQWWEGVKMQKISVHLPLTGGIVLGASTVSADYGDIEGYSALDAPMGSVKAGYSLTTFGLGYRMGKMLTGFGLMNISERLSSENTGSAEAFIFASAFELRKFKTGFSYLIPSGKISYGEGSSEQKIPSILRAGLSFRIYMLGIFFGMTMPSPGDGFQTLGAEILMMDCLKLRAGINTVDSVIGSSAGFSLLFEKVSIDYAYGSAEFGSAIQSVAVSLQFGYSTLKSRLYSEAKRLFKQGFYDQSQERIKEVLILDPNHLKAKILGAKIAEIIAQIENSSKEEVK